MISRLKNGIRVVIQFIISGVIVCVGLELFSAYDNHQSHLKKMELLEEQVKTSKIEREKYEKQIVLISGMLENEKIRNETYKKLR